MSDRDSLALLAKLGAIPSAPLHEAGVAACVVDALRERGVPIHVDTFGNVIATYQRGHHERPLALVAHLDHPGIEITSQTSSTRAKASLLGGVSPKCFSQPVPVRLIGRQATVAGNIVGCEVDPQTQRVASLDVEASGPVAVGDFGVFDLVGFHSEGDQIAMRAADDLAGVAAALAALFEIQARQIEGTVYGVFTRAEEIGLVGATLVANAQLLPMNMIVVSLECSRTLPGAEPGRGPVIRVGDATSAFHPAGEAVLLAARRRLSDVPIQRQLMSGGTCEATAFSQAGYQTTGVAIPLVNYHNVGPGEVIAPERINAQDFLGEIALLVAAAEVSHTDSVSEIGRRLDQAANRYRERLLTTAAEIQSMAVGH